MYKCRIILAKARSADTEEAEERSFEKLPDRDSHISFGNPARTVYVKCVEYGAKLSVINVRELDMLERKMVNRPQGCPVTFV
jgi:hypothetical protein